MQAPTKDSFCRRQLAGSAIDRLVFMKRSKSKKHTQRPSRQRATAPAPAAAPPPELPTYDSMQQCAARSGIPLALIKRAKRYGCTAFAVGSRVRLQPLLAWLFSTLAEEAGIDWGNELKKWQAKRQQQFWEQREGNLVDVDDVTHMVLEVSARQRQILTQRLQNEMPTAMAGVDPGSGRIIGKRIVDEICRELEQFIEQWTKSSND